jgi:hypothetical protein
MGHDSVDQTEPSSLTRIANAPRQDQLDGRLAANIAWQTLSTAELRNDQDVNLCFAERCCFGCDCNVTRLNYFVASAKCKPIDCEG